MAEKGSWLRRGVKWGVTLVIGLVSGVVRRKYPDLGVSPEVVEDVSLAIVHVVDLMIDAFGIDTFVGDHPKEPLQITVEPEKVKQITQAKNKLMEARKSLLEGSK